MTHVLRCRSSLQFVSLGQVPPRMPGRTDAQVPHSLDDGPVRYARFASLYFYADAAPTDPAFGFVDLEIAVQRFGDGRCECALYCVGDGYQSGDGSRDADPLRIQFAVGDRIAGAIDWPFPDVAGGTSDPVTFQGPVALSAAEFDAIDRIVIPSVTASCRIDLD